MGILKQFFNNTRKPNGWMGKLMVNGMNQGHAAVSDWGLSYFPDVPGAAHSMLADFGCGGGRNTAELLKRFPEARVTALDYSKVACDKTKQFNRNEVQAGRCNVVQGDVSRLPFEAATFDVITAFETVYFWPGPVESFQEVWRVLKPGGTFMIVNESDGRNTKDEKWAGIIDGMRIFTQERLTQYLKRCRLFPDSRTCKSETTLDLSPGGESTVRGIADSKFGFIEISYLQHRMEG